MHIWRSIVYNVRSVLSADKTKTDNRCRRSRPRASTSGVGTDFAYSTPRLVPTQHGPMMSHGGGILLSRVDRKGPIVPVLVLVIVIEYQARSGSLSGIVRRLSPAMDDGVLALTLNPAAAGRRGNRMEQFQSGVTITTTITVTSTSTTMVSA